MGREDESLVDLGWLNTNTNDLSNTSIFETPHTLASQFLHETIGLGVTSTTKPNTLRVYAKGPSKWESRLEKLSMLNLK